MPHSIRGSPVPRSIVRALVFVSVLVGGFFGAVGGLALRPPGIIAVGVAGLLAALTAAAIAHDGPRRSMRSTVEAAVLTGAGTVGCLLVVSGTAVIAGGTVTVALLATAVLVFLLRNGRRPDLVRPAAPPSTGPLFVVSDPGDAGPVAGLSTAALGREWLRTSAALTGRLDAAARRSIVDRREATLDELERRDPDGFSRWLSAGPAAGSDPAEFVRGGPVTGTEAA